MATIKDIARLAGVSSATVSRVLNESGYASEEAKEKVQKAIQELDYVPNQNAVFLKTGSTKNLGIVTTRITPTASVLITNFILAAEEKGYSATVFITNDDNKRELEAFDMLRSKQLDGIFTIYRANEWDALFDYTKHGPIVALQRIEDERISSVYIDHYVGYRMALEFLWDTGCRNIMNVYSLDYGLNTKIRIKAYEDFCREHNLTPHPPDLFVNYFNIEDGERAAQWFHEQKEKPDAFLVQSDFIASGLVAQLRKLGYHLPEDVSVIGFDNLEMSYLMDITTVDYMLDVQAKNAFSFLYNQLQAKEQLPVTDLSFRLIERGTTRKGEGRKKDKTQNK